MSAATMHRRAGLLRYAAIQFVVLTTVAMQAYGGGKLLDRSAPGYDPFGNFLSDLGATRAWSGQPNHVAAALFSIALGTLGIAFMAFAGAWSSFAFAQRRARGVGIASRVCGTLSGAAFLGVAVTPVNLALDLHNALVVAAFALLLGYAATLSYVSALNGASRTWRLVTATYLVLVGGYVAVVVLGVRAGITSPRGLWILVASQKAIAYASMLYVLYLTTAARGQLPIMASRRSATG